MHKPMFKAAGWILLATAAGAACYAQTFSIPASFKGANGASPLNVAGSSIVQGPDGNFYGTTRSGGANQAGTIFKMTPGGGLTALYSFTGQADGSEPQSGLIAGTDGNLYGATSTSIFKITPSGTFTTLYTYNPSTGGPNNLNALVQGADGNFYGTDQGSVFKITPAGALTVLYKFNGIGSLNLYPNTLVQASDGNLYGTTPTAAFKITTSGTLTQIATLQAPLQGAVGPLIQASDGNLYGVTETGGTAQSGTVFRMTLAGAVSTLYTFCAQSCSTGDRPMGGLIQGKDGNLYGTTSGGGAANGGTIFQIGLAGALTKLHDFCTNKTEVCVDGNNPEGSLIQARNGILYGTASGGGPSNGGVVYTLQLPYSCTNTAPVTISSIDSASAYGGYNYFASGSWLEIKGANLADPADPRLATGSGQWSSADFNGSQAPTNLDGISVSINGKPAYVWYLSPTQLNVQAPEDSATGNVAITVTNCKATSSISMFPRQALAPGLLAPPNYSSGGTPYLVATFVSGGAYVLNTGLGASFGLNARPAKPGDEIIAYGIGFGDVTPSILPGTVVSESNQLVNPVTFSFGSTPATLSYWGLAGSFVGLYEFYVTVPSGLADGDYQINVSQNGAALPQTFYLTVKN